MSEGASSAEAAEASEAAEAQGTEGLEATVEGTSEYGVQTTTEDATPEVNAVPYEGLDPSELEALLHEMTGEESTAQLIDLIQKHGYTEAQAKALQTEIGRGRELKQGFLPMHKWGIYRDRVKNIQGKSFWGWLKGMYYLGMAFLDITPAEYQETSDKIAQGSKDIYITGMFAIPRNISAFEKRLGRPVTYVASIKVDEIYNIIKDAALKNGPVRIYGFSDGGTMLGKVLDKYGGEVEKYIDRSFCVSSIPLRHKNVIHVIGERDWLVPMVEDANQLDKNYQGPKHHLIPGGHAWHIGDKDTINGLVNVVESYGPRRAYNTIGGTIKATWTTQYNNRHFTDRNVAIRDSTQNIRLQNYLPPERIAA